MTDTLPFDPTRKPELPKPEERRPLSKRKKRQSMKDQVRVGMRFGHWEIVAPAPARNGHAHFGCRCVCGKTKSVMGGHLTSGRSTSCGCKKPGKYRHGLTNTRTHRIWQRMRSRCSNPNLPDFKHYGGRGIRVCERWQVFENFLSDMGHCPDGLSIDRINNEKGYEPGNCRWATQKEQTRNQRKTIRLTYEGRTLSLPEWSEIKGMDPACLFWRHQQGWSHDRILGTTSLKDRHHTITIEGETMKLSEWSQRSGVPLSSIVARYAKGLRGKAAVYGEKHG